MLVRLARLERRRARLVLSVAVLATAVAAAFGASVAKNLAPYGADDPATQSVQARQLFERATRRQIDPGVVALVETGDLRTPAARQQVLGVERRLAASPDVAQVISYYDVHDPAMVARDGRSTYALAYFRPQPDKRIEDDARVIQQGLASSPNVRLGGAAIANAQVNSRVSSDLERSELIALPLIFALSLLFFRSLVAALLPPLLGGMAIACTFFALQIAGHFVVLSVFAVNLVTGAGLGLAIDYSLFMVSRYREEAASVGFTAAALETTLATAGRTVLFSAVTVAAAIASLAIFPQRFLYSMGIGGVLVVSLAATLAVAVLPALLWVLGPRVNAMAPRWLGRAAERDARPEARGLWYRLSQFVMRRASRVAVVSAAFLIGLGLPFAGVRFTAVDANVLPASASARQVADTLNRDFAPNRDAPLELVIAAPAQAPRVQALAASIGRLPDVAAVSAPQPAAPGLTLVAAAPLQGPLTGASQRLVRDIRGLHEPFYVGVAGESAAQVDLSHSLTSHLPLVLAVVVAATLAVLFLMTGSVVLPLKAVLMNALNLSATFGVLVLIFQDGRLQGPLGYTSQGALETTQPILLFAIAFGLATDYGVFLLSRIKEAHDGGVSNKEAVAAGLERTGRIVTAAAILFAVAVSSFALSQIVFIKELGIGTALAVLIDASIIRALLVPSLMAVLGSTNWWAPAPVRRFHAWLTRPRSGQRVSTGAFG